MKLAHLADLHLGFRQFERTTAGGQNAREVDVAIAFRRAVDDLIAQRPDVIAIAGDVFHTVRPTNQSILVLLDQLTRLRCELPEAVVVVAAGNHDTPRSSETGCILQIVERLGVHFAMLEPKVIPLPGVTITAVPSNAATAVVRPDPAAELNVLVIHGDVAGYGSPAPRDPIDPDELERMAWDYVALGDYHVCAQVGTRAWYSGALEYTATNPWGELMKQNELLLTGKGYLLVELPGGEPVFRSIGPVRRHVDLPPIEATGKTAAELDAEIASRVAETEIDGAVVRLVVREVKREVKAALNYARIRDWKARALNFHLDLRRAEEEIATPARRAALHRRVDETLAAFLGDRALPPGMNRTEFIERGLEYLKSVSEDPYTGDPVPGLGAGKA